MEAVRILPCAAASLQSRKHDVDMGCEQAGDQRLTDTRQDEQDRCITIKSTGAAASQAQ